MLTRRFLGEPADRPTSIFPDPDVPSSKLAPEDSEPWDSRRPLIAEKSAGGGKKKTQNEAFSSDESARIHIFLKSEKLGGD